MYLHFFKPFLFSFVLIGCSVKPISTPNTQSLSTLLHTIDPSIPKAQSQALAKDIYKHTHTLTQVFKLTSPPQYHNFLITIGVKEKGLCYHWSDALFLHLNTPKYPSFSFHLMGANIGNYWNEHNTLLITSKNKPISKGIIIDPWRNSGVLYFEKVLKDENYEWVHRRDRCLGIVNCYYLYHKELE